LLPCVLNVGYLLPKCIFKDMVCVSCQLHITRKCLVMGSEAKWWLCFNM